MASKETNKKSSTGAKKSTNSVKTTAKKDTVKTTKSTLSKTAVKKTVKSTTKDEKSIVATVQTVKEDNVVSKTIPADSKGAPIVIPVPKTDNAQNGEGATNIIINLTQEKKKRTTSTTKKKKTNKKPQAQKQDTKKTKKKHNGGLVLLIILLLLLATICAFLFPYVIKNDDDDKNGSNTPLWEITADGKYMYFGSYPQRLATADERTTINTESADENGYYLDTNGNKYKKITANPYDNNVQFSDTTTIIDAEEYYFKVEKIKWRILEKENNTAVLLSESILDAHEYGDGKNAIINQWLNDTFISNFTSSEQQIILTGTDSTHKVFLMDKNSLGDNDWFDADINTASPKREKQTSDYARAQNITFENANGNGWWLYSNGENLGYVADNGVVHNHTSLPIGGIAPTITINLKVSNNKTTTYTVKHYKQKLGNWKTTGLTAEDCTVELEYKSSAPNTSVTPSTKVYTGFTAPRAQTVKVNKNGNTVVEYFYTRNQYRVTINNDNGIKTATASGTGYNAGIAQYGATINLTAILETGYNFANWIGYKTLADKDTSFMVDTVPTGNIITITATSIGKPYKLAFDTNTTDESSETPADQDVVYDNQIGTLPTPTRDGYKFNGWYKDADCTEGNEVEEQTDFNENNFDTINHNDSTQKTTLYAKWTENIYSIAFNANGGTGLIEDITSITYTHTQQLPPNTFTKAGYTFSGWATSSTGSKVYDDEQEVSKLTTTNGTTVTFYAVWTADTNTAYSVEYYLQNLANDDYTKDTSKTINATGTTDTAINIDGYKTTITGFEFASADPTSTNIKGDGSTVVKLYYKRITSTLTLTTDTGIASVSASGDGVTSNSGTYTVKYDAIVTLTATASAGYTFSGWTVTSGSATISSGTYTHGTNNVEIKATATANTYTITFSGNATDDTISISSTSANVTYATAIGTLPTATRTGYEFDGWFVETSGTTKITATTILNSTNFATIDHTNKTLTVYAKWTACTYGEWQHDEDEHWKVCSNCNGETAHVAHTFKNGICDICEYARDELTFSYDGATNSYTVTGIGRVTATDIVIPATYDDGTNGSHPVKSVGESAFQFNSNITGVVFSENMEMIGDGAFTGCERLTSVTLSSTIKEIGTWAFAITGLTSINIPASVETIGDNPFMMCEDLTTITVNIANTNFHVNNSCLIDTINKKIITGLSYSNVPSNSEEVTMIGYSAFWGISSGIALKIPSNITAIDKLAFKDCASIVSVELPVSITIKEQAFSDCTSLTTIYYAGESQTEWSNNVTLAAYNSSLTNSTRYYCSETEPMTTGKYWHYVDSVATPWAEKMTYKVEHYVENENGGYNTPESTENLVGIIGSEVTATTKTYAHYTHDTDNSLADESGTVTSDGNLVLKVYYYRNSYTLTLAKGTGIASVSITGASDVTTISEGKYSIKHGEAVRLIATAEAGYTFSSWTGYSSIDSSNVFTMPTENVTLTANATANTNTGYKVEHHTEKLDGTFALEDTDNLTGTTDTTATASAKTFTGFTYDASKVESGAIKGDGSLVLKVYYSRNSYTLTLTKGENVANVTATGTYVTANTNNYTVKYGATVTLSVTTSTGYSFSTWTGYTFTGNSFTMPTENVSIMANATANTYSLTYNTNGGNTISAVSKAYGSAFTPTELPTPTRAGYTFDGWYNNSTHTTKITTSSVFTTATATFANVANANTTAIIYAKWNPNTNTEYSIEYYLQNLANSNYTEDTTRTVNATGTTDTAINIDSYKTEITGFEFASAFPTSTTINGDGNTVVKLYYTRKTSTLTLTAGTGIASVSASGTGVTSATSGYTVKYGAEVTITATASAGYTFSNWTVTDNTVTVSDNKYAHNVTSNVSITANATGKTYSLTYNTNGGNTISAVSKTYGTAFTSSELSTPTKTGYTFEGWYKDSAHTTKITTSSVFTTSTATFANVANANTNATIYANWTENTYTIAFNSNGGNGTMNSITGVAYTESKVLTTNTYTKTGCAFLGWSEDQDATTKTYDNGATVTRLTADNGATVTLYAIWHEHNYSWNYNSTSHYQECATCDSTINSGSHSYGTDGLCTCGRSQLQFEYKTSTQTYAVKGIGDYTGTTLTIPTTYNDGTNGKKAVTSIAANAFNSFYNASTFTSVFISSSITSIGEKAFASCRNIASMTVAEGNTVLHSKDNCIIDTANKKILAGCKNSIIPTSSSEVTSIGDYAFYGHEDLTSITLSTNITSVGQYGVSRTGITSLTIPSSMTVIGICAFDGNHELLSLTIPTSVKTIKWGAFQYSTKLPSIVIPEGVETIEANAFSYCYKLVSISIPSTVTSIGSSFAHDAYLEEITVAEGNTKYLSQGNCLIEIETKTLISGCKTSVIPTDSSVVTSIGEDAFASNLNVEQGNITIPANIESIGEGAFYACWITRVYFASESNLKYIGKEAFLYCEYLSHVVLPEGLETIDNWALKKCDNLTQIVIPSTVTTIGKDVFDTVHNLTIYYAGSETDWDAININSTNDNLNEATLYYYSETEPTTTGNYWHWVVQNDVRVLYVWGEE